ncbi:MULTISPECIES: DUF2612 domain-containing protein [unclassified Gilliamella]|uniref:DUF2612 domain-containing protein n=1 Tax=unclassified Gilliamella TaxID=2685620 RepID=UPI0018DCB0DA|nr:MULTISPECIES: DUF2612 domain-containing protein [unclassified Gilliamella]MBI0114495.1 DUF2612 domain-containing protein [Gilliamella sp. W8123]MBI0118136.1 DUF2612 domain-containing protein [Gilliamella sp. W8129]
MNRENFIIWQYRTKPKAFGTIRAVYKETDLTFQNIIQIADILNIDTATGYALDLVGRHIGVSRVLPTAIAKEYFGWLEDDSALSFGVGEFYRYGDALSASVVLNDNDYRFFIRAKITKNYQNGTIENIVKSIQFVVGNNSNVIDIQNMTMNIIVNSDNLNSLTLYAISKMDILVRPVGVMYEYTVLVNDKPFGFAHDNGSYGFNIGKFVRLQEIGIN